VSAPLALLESLGLTLAVELPMAALLGLRTRMALFVVLLVNLMTNPTLGCLLLVGHRLGIGSSAYAAAWLVGEVAVVAVEWRLLVWALGGRSRSLLAVALAMNLASAAVGAVVL
jgi:hypothetical protein